MKKTKHILTILPLAIFLWLLSACSETYFFYQDDARIRIEGPSEWTLGSDSLLFSFAAFPATVTEMVIDATLYVIGTPVPHNRTALVEIVAANTTATSAHYSLSTQITIPANAYSAPFPITLIRTADLEERTVRLLVRVRENEDFGVGVLEQRQLLLQWNDILSMPPNWDVRYREFFGEWSAVKHRFMIDNGFPGLIEADALLWAQLMNFQILFRTALDAYNAVNPGNPLRDENGILITF